MFNWFREEDTPKSSVHVHVWTKWEITRRIRIFDKDESKYPIGHKTVQERKCKNCGFVEQNVGDII